MKKRALMLSAAVVAALSTPAFAAAPVDAVATTPQKTSTLPNPLTIAANGGIKLTSGTTPLLTIDSNNVVTNNGNLTFDNTASAVGVLFDGSKNTVGSFTNNLNIDLTGSGTGKDALHLSDGGAAAGSYTGTISLGTASIVKVAGDTSTGIRQDSGFLLNGDLSLGGTFTMTPTASNGTAASGINLASLLGTIKGNVSVISGAVYTAVGNNANGIVIAGPLLPCDKTLANNSACAELGTFSNSGTINVVGVASRSSTAANAESGSALIIGNSISGGILNNGPLDLSGTIANAIISANGVNAPTLLITPAASAGNITIGLDTPDANGTNSFINRGNITAAPEDSNKSTRDIVISGSATQTITFLGGFFNSGLINAQATSISPGNRVSAIALEIDSYITIPEIEVSGQSAAGTNTNGVISASINGPEGGIATAILITGQPVNGATVTNVPNITIDSGGRVLAVANTTDPTNKAVTQLEAIAIEDRSNSLVTLNNNGTISATATPLTNGFTSVAHAVDTSFDTVGLNFTNKGTVVGDVLLGSGSDTYTVEGISAQQVATQTGDINFGASIGGANVDTLNVNNFANVSGAITDQGALDINIASNATLSVKNLPTSVQNNLQVQNLIIAGGSQTSAGQLNITVSSGLVNIPLIQASQKIDFGAGANLNVTFGGFVPQGGTFLLLSAPHGNLIFEDPNAVANFSAEIGQGAGLPFLFKSASIMQVTVGGTDFLELNVAAKSAADLGLTGLAAKMFSAASAAIASDDALGAALIAGINSPQQAQAAFDAFAPEVSGGTRAVALSLTDQATGVVAARQRQLRLFSKSPGELTLWGNEFGEYLSTHGQTKTGVVGDTLPVGTVCAGKCPSVSLAGFKDHGFGFSLGLDSGAPETGWYGGAFTFYTGDVQAGRTGAVPNAKTGELWYLLTGYSDWRGKGLFLDTQASVGYGQLKGKRFLTLQIPVTNGFTTFTREADNTHAALVGALGATMGAVMKYGATTVTPQLSLDGMTLRQEGYNERNGGTGFNLSVKSSYATSVRLFLGTEAREDIDVGDFFLQPSARVGYRFDLLNGAEKVRAQFSDIDSTTAGNQPGALFSIQGPDPSRGNIVGGLNLNATTDNWTIGLSYDFVRGSNNATQQSGVISLLGRI